MARTKVDNKLNVVIGTKAQVEADNTIPENSIVVVTDEELTESVITIEDTNAVNKTLTLSDSNKLIVFGATDTTDQTLTIPTNASVPFPIGTMITFILFSKSVTFVASSGVVLSSMDGLVTLATKYGMATLIKTDTDTWQLVGALE